MKPIAEAWCIQIELNNYCPHDCSYCTRFTSHLRQDQRYNMKAEELAEILDTLRTQHGYSGKLGIIGGEPTVHPDFTNILKVIWEHWSQYGNWIALWTSGGNRYEIHKTIIDKVFSWIAYNDHSDPMCHHQPMTMASCDVVLDSELRDELIDNCWVQRIWCPSITPKGVFFCECAAAWDRILDGPGGWPIDSDWLSYGPEQYRDQKEYCQLCGMSVPMEDSKLGEPEKISVSVLDAFEKHEVDFRGMVLDYDDVDREEFEKRVAAGWAPGEYTPGRAKGGV